MKKLFIPISLLFIMAACGGNNSNDVNINEKENSPPMTNTEEEVNEPDGNNAQIENENEAENTKADDPSTDQEYFKEKMETLEFKDFELEVEYGDDKEYEAEVDLNKDGTYDVEIEDEINDVYLKDREAFDDLFPRLESLDVTSESNNSEVINQVIDAFELDKDFTKFDVEIEFNNGVEIEITHRD